MVHRVTECIFSAYKVTEVMLHSKQTLLFREEFHCSFIHLLVKFYFNFVRFVLNVSTGSNTTNICILGKRQKYKSIIFSILFSIYIYLATWN